MSVASIWVLGAGAGLLALGSALFSAMETALFSFQNHDLERLRRGKARHVKALSRILRNPRRLLGVLVLGEVLLNVPLVLVCLYFLRSGLFPVLSFWGSELLLLGVVVFVCDLLPKVAALSQPYRMVRPAVLILEPLLRWLEEPLNWMQRFTDRFAEKVLPVTAAKGHLLDQSEMETLVEIGAEEGALHPVESAIIQEIIHLRERTVRDCMTPRVDALWLPDDLSADEIVERLKACRYRRVPVYGATPDDILGILDTRVFLESTGVHYTEMLVPPSFVPETMRALDLLRSFLMRPQGLAIVVDEHGGTEGIITRADLVEEVLSEALPGGARELYLEALGDGRIVASGGARLEDVSEAMGVEVACDGIDTVGGLVFNLSGALPRLGASFEFGSIKITVRRTSRKRVEEVLVESSNQSSTKGGG